MIDTLLSVDWTGIVLWICVVALILCGVAGTVVPALPGIPMIFLGALLAAWIGDFQHITWVPLVVLGVLTIIGLAVDWVAQTMGAQRAGASKWGIMGSLVGTVAGLFMGIVGILFMPLVGAFIGEYIAQRDLRIAGNVGWATWVGMMVGTVVKLGLSFVMIGIMCFGKNGRSNESTSRFSWRCRLENFAGVVSQTATFAALQRDVACVGPSAELLNDVGEP